MFDEMTVQCFLKNQLQLYPEKVAETYEEAENFLEECMAVVVDSVREVLTMEALMPVERRELLIR